ncbi:putative MATE family efflux protein [Clostridium tetanomorphum]|uniref:MATE family efflux transporter n=1 Tax=Clostridium tetanomorphum TaxID=1553 RepID=UPI0004474A9B|nr:MATE family efflux transporter [Clostridium tetanomorphum]KAJ51988.1 Na+ driven multidrug efflux pump [Clostridium tetanomorphum DSM 665]MBP1862908.1 putative MATE family efflux protein [Clostridium tetanomorphum]NRS87045.1 putative MATE family efflux protein [Clostridium tetanomorphum]SQC00148.1 Na+ driven multidrug efflux pump [Clostridium tetanomorphum]
MESVTRNLFKDKEFFRTLFKLALPIIIQNFIASFLNMIDTIMVGRLGEAQIASVGIANQYFLLFNLLVLGTFSGCGIFISQFWGKRDIKNIRRILGLALISGIIISLILASMAAIFPTQIISIFNKDPKVILYGSQYLKVICISYIFTAITLAYSVSLRCVGQAIVPMLVSAVALLCNTFFNYIFIFGKFGAPVLGVKGAALATLIARIIESVLLVTYVYKTKGVLAAKLGEMLDLTKEFIIKVVSTVIHVVLNEACWGLGTIVYSAVYGRIGTKAVASVQICTTVQNLFMVITFGIANAATVMIGNKIGANKEDLGKIYAKRFSIIGCTIGLSLGILLWISSSHILSLFNVSNEVLHDSLIILRITSIIMIIRVFNIILIVGILRGGGDAKYSLMVEAFTMWCIGVPLSLIGAFLLKFPVYWVVALVTIEEIVKCIVGLTRLLSNRWVRNVVLDM